MVCCPLPPPTSHSTCTITVVMVAMHWHAPFDKQTRLVLNFWFARMWVITLSFHVSVRYMSFSLGFGLGLSLSSSLTVCWLLIACDRLMPIMALCSVLCSLPNKFVALFALSVALSLSLLWCGITDPFPSRQQITFAVIVCLFFTIIYFRRKHFADKCKLSLLLFYSWNWIQNIFPLTLRISCSLSLSLLTKQKSIKMHSMQIFRRMREYFSFILVFFSYILQIIKIKWRRQYRVSLYGGDWEMLEILDSNTLTIDLLNGEKRTT